MSVVLLIAVVLLAGVCGDRVMDRADRFLEKQGKGEEEDGDEPGQR